MAARRHTRDFADASGGPERARGLDLGADEVLTSPWSGGIARARGVQLREKYAFDELRERLELR